MSNNNDKYVYPSEKLKQLAKENVNENPEQVNAHIESFRRWVQSMPHLKCPTNAKFLIMFLRVAKFDHAKAQKRLDNFCTIRSSERGHPEMFKFPAINDAVFEKTIRLGSLIPGGLTNNGEFFNIGRMEKYDPKVIPINTYMSILYMVIEMQLFKHEEMQVSGTKYFSDLHNMGKNLMEVMSDPKHFKIFSRIFQDCYPLRMKGQVIYREPPWYAMILNIVMFFLYEKHQKRIYRVKDNLQKAFEYIPGLEKILPKEYGGQGDSAESMIEKLFTEMKEHYKDGGPWKSISVDESKRPKDTLDYLKHYADYNGPQITRGTDGTFVQLDVL